MLFIGNGIAFPYKNYMMIKKCHILISPLCVNIDWIPNIKCCDTLAQLQVITKHVILIYASYQFIDYYHLQWHWYFGARHIFPQLFSPVNIICVYIAVMALPLIGILITLNQYFHIEVFIWGYLITARTCTAFSIHMFGPKNPAHRIDGNDFHATKRSKDFMRASTSLECCRFGNKP